MIRDADNALVARPQFQFYISTIMMFGWGIRDVRVIVSILHKYDYDQGLSQTQLGERMFQFYISTIMICRVDDSVLHQVRFNST